MMTAKCGVTVISRWSVKEARLTPLRGSDQLRIASIRDEILMVAKLEKVSETA
jgi:hypothetical protein